MDKLINKSKNRWKNTSGFATLELMISLAIISLILTAVILVSFSNQSFLIGSQTSNEAMKLAQSIVEEEQALARKDFNLVNSTTLPEQDIYTRSVSVKTLPDFLTKEVKAVINWKGERGQDKVLELKTLITNFDSPVGGNTCDSNLAGDWSDPEIEQTIDFSTLPGIPVSAYTISDVDAFKGKLYVTASETTNLTDPTFFVFDISDPSDPELEGEIDNESASTTSAGLSAVRVSEDPADMDRVYAYTTNAYMCDPTTINPACNGQLYIFDVTNQNPAVEAKIKIISSPAIVGPTAGTSVFYKNGYVFVGLVKTDGPEFNILDVHNPEDLSNGSYSAVGSFETEDGLNALHVRNNFAYLATTNLTSDDELRILNISSLNAPYPGASGAYYGFNSATGAGRGKSLYLVGDRLYLGKTSPNAGNDFHILDNLNPAGTLTELGGIDVGSSINSLIVRDYLSFLLTNSQLRVYRTDDEGAISLLGSLSLPSTGSSTEPSMDCEGNRLYISANNAIGEGSIYIIAPNE